MVPGEVMWEHLRGLNSPTPPDSRAGKPSRDGSDVIDGDYRRVDE